MGFWFYFIFAAAFIVGYIVLRRYQNVRPYTREVIRCMLATGVMVLWKALMFIKMPVIAFSIVYSLFELTHVFVMASYVYFACELCYRTVPRRTYRVFSTLCVLDIISFIVNLLTGHLYTISANGPDMVISRTAFFESHRILLYLNVAYILFSLVYRMTKIYYAYWFKYVILILAMVFLVIGDFIRSEFMEHTEFTELGYIAAVILMVVLVLVLRSRVLRSYEYAEAFDSISQHIMLFDNQDHCVLVNNGASDFFNISPFFLDRAESIIKTLDPDGEIKKCDGTYSKLCTYYKDDKKYHLRLDYKRIMHRNKYAGALYGFTDVTEETEELIEQTHLARYDSFTMIYDRNWLFSEIEKEIEENPDNEYYVIGSDIRDFKVFNDVFGKDAGDKVIIHMAGALRKLYDKGNIIKFGRIFADRFGMLADKKAFSEELMIKEFLKIDHPFNEDYYHLNIHFGIYPTKMDRGLPVKSMFDRAFVALDAIKNEINVRSYHYNEIMRDEKIWEQTISANIERAIKEGQLRIVVQPQVNRDEKVIGGEALVRWRDPSGKEISPGEFIPVLEKTGLVTSADMHVWEESCKLLRRWKDMGYNDYYISVNISATDFIFADIFAIFSGLVEKHGVDAKNLKLEITETAMMTDVLERIVLIKRLEDYGFAVELDDFGSGYSSLNMLKEIPVDVIKMDMKFLYDEENDSNTNSKKIIGHIIQMAKDLDMEIVAEGVETQEQLSYLRDMGCDTFQGYYFSKPLEVSDFEQKNGIA